jgi:hypothetical protein
MNANRNKGHKWERKCVNVFKTIFPMAVTSRAESLSEDTKGIDICHTGDWAFQCKATKVTAFKDWFAHMDTDKKKAILYKNTKHPTLQPEYVVVSMKDFVELLGKKDLCNTTHNETRDGAKNIGA